MSAKKIVFDMWIWTMKVVEALLIIGEVAKDPSDTIEFVKFGYKMSNSLIDLSLHLNHQFVFPSGGA